MKSDFLEYIQKEFWFDDREMQDFETYLIAPLKKSIRVNTNKISVKDFQTLALSNGWVLTPTWYGKNTFYIDRSEDLKIALWNTFEHLSGYFYVQEVAASTSPYYLCDDRIDETPYLILDMSAAPGGKSTQLSEYYPNSIIIANEIDKTRLRALEENIDRMGATNILVTNYDGRHFKNTPEMFDKILLDAPCSGEGTSFKTEEALRFWNMKNIETISRLQIQLLESALVALKVWGEMVYSTCTLNTIENEQVVEKMLEKYSESLEIIEIDTTAKYHRNWPHRDKTWGFFVAKIRKVASMNSEYTPQKRPLQNFEKLQNKQEKYIEDFLKKSFWYAQRIHLLKYKESIFLTGRSVSFLWEHLFFFKVWIEIGTLRWGNFEPSFFLGTLRSFEKWILAKSIDECEKLLSGYEIEDISKDWYYQILSPKGVPIWMARLKWKRLKSLIPSKLTRK